MSFNVGHFVVVLVFTVQLLVLNVSTSTASREKRSDDGDPLEAVVEHLSQQVTALNAQLTQQANSFTAQLNSVNTEVAALKAKTGTYSCLSNYQLCIDCDPFLN